MSAAALRAIMDAIEIDTVAEVSAVHFTPVGLADLAGALAEMIEAARAEARLLGLRYTLALTLVACTVIFALAGCLRGATEASRAVARWEVSDGE